MAQWFHVYDMSLEDMKTVFRTYNQAFHYVTIWNIQIGDLVLIGSNKPYAIDLERFEKIQANEFLHPNH